MFLTSAALILVLSLTEYRLTGFTFYDEAGHLVSIDSEMIEWWATCLRLI